ncbi:hypothetical protein ACIKJQ_12475, partial [Bacillus thuringiensis]
MEKKRNKGMNKVLAATIAFTTLATPTSAVFADENGLKKENDSVILNEQQPGAQDRSLEGQTRTSPNRFVPNSINYSIDPRGLRISIKTSLYFAGERVSAFFPFPGEGLLVEKNIPSNKEVEFIVTGPLPYGEKIWFSLVGALGTTVDQVYFTVPTDINIAPDKPILDPVTDTDDYITGTVKKPSNGHVVAIQGGQKIPVNADGTFKIPISKQTAGTVLTVYSYHNTTNTWDVSSSSVTVQKTVTAPTAPEVNAVTDTDTTVTGKAKAGSTVS